MAPPTAPSAAPRCFTVTTSPVGDLVLTGDHDGTLTGCWFTGPGFDVDRSAGLRRDDAALAGAVVQLEEYFAGERRCFDLPLAPMGTEFQRQVWKRLRAIPYGETRSYGQVATELGQPRASRAVGLANGRNPLSIIVACHRVIGADGRLTGYGGGIDRKRYLLDLESGTMPLT